MATTVKGKEKFSQVLNEYLCENFYSHELLVFKHSRSGSVHRVFGHKVGDGYDNGAYYCNDKKWGNFR